jgi:hypothetical protein
MFKKYLVICLIGIFLVGSLGPLSAKTYYYPCHLEVGKTYGLGDGTTGCQEWINTRDAQKNGKLNFWTGLFVSEWDSLCNKLESMGIATKNKHKSISCIEAYDLTPIVAGHWENVKVKIGSGYDPDYFDVEFQ